MRRREPEGPRCLLSPHVPEGDPGGCAIISEADTIGVFQIESRAQSAMLPRLRPQCFYDLIIEIAIVRAGPVRWLPNGRITRS